MQRKIFIIVGASLIAASTVQITVASGRSRVHKVDRATASEQFRNANNSAAWSSQPGWYSGYSGGFSAPAGH